MRAHVEAALLSAAHFRERPAAHPAARHHHLADRFHLPAARRPRRLDPDRGSGGAQDPGLGTAITIAVIYLIGLAAGSIVGARILRAVETVFLRLPFVRSIYGPARQLFSVLGRDQGSSQEVVLVEYPRKGLYMMGFVTDRDIRSVSVFLPTTPNPTSGFLVLCDPGEVTPLAVTFPEAMNFIVSGGVVKPGQPLFPGHPNSPAFPDPGAKIEPGS